MWIIQYKDAVLTNMPWQLIPKMYYSLEEATQDMAKMDEKVNRYGLTCLHRILECKPINLHIA